MIYMVEVKVIKVDMGKGSSVPQVLQAVNDIVCIIAASFSCAERKLVYSANIVKL